MYGYLSIRFDVVDREAFRRYIAAVVPMIEGHGGRILIGNETRHLLEGSAQQMTVLIQSPHVDAAQGFCDSPEYAL